MTAFMLLLALLFRLMSVPIQQTYDQVYSSRDYSVFLFGVQYWTFFFWDALLFISRVSFFKIIESDLCYERFDQYF